MWILQLQRIYRFTWTCGSAHPPSYDHWALYFPQPRQLNLPCLLLTEPACFSCPSTFNKSHFTKTWYHHHWLDFSMQQAFVVVLILAPSVSSLTSPGTPYPGHLPLLLFCPSILFSFKPPLDRYFPGGFPWPPESFEVCLRAHIYSCRSCMVVWPTLYPGTHCTHSRTYAEDGDMPGWVLSNATWARTRIWGGK